MKKLNFIFGKKGEKLAEDYLKKKGHKIIKKNFRTKFGEIDIITQKKKKIHFIEVKTRSSDLFGNPALAVNKRKMNKIIKVAQYFFLKNRIVNINAQFDIISIIVKNNVPEIQYIEKAFSP